MAESTRVTTAMDERSGLGRYRVEGEIGRGTTGVVHRAYDTAAGRRVALKTVRLAFPVGAADRLSFEERFLAEAQVAARLDHPNIVKVYDCGRDEATGSLFIAFEHLEGSPLSDLVKPGTRLPWRDAVRIARRVAEALQHAHARGVVHRDVKPGNIVLLPSGEPKVLDFGIARAADTPGAWSTAGQVVGTPSYMSPEQALGRPADARSDIFSLGAVLYFLLTARPPFAAGTIPRILLRVIREDPLPASRFVPGLPGVLDDVLARALSKAPAERYPTARAMAEDLGDILAGRAPRHGSTWTPRRANATLPFAPDRTEGPVPPPAPLDDTLVEPRHPSRAASRDAALGALALAAVATVGFAWPRTQPPLDGLAAAGISRPRPPIEVIAAGPALPAPVAVSVAPRVAAPAPVAPAATTPPRTEDAPPLARPAYLALEFQHSLKDEGRLRVFVDDVLRVDQALSRGRKDAASVAEVLEVAPGVHRVRVEARWDDNVRSQQVKAAFLPGESRRLTARLGGLLSKKVALRWTEPGPRRAALP